jgi:hypothetical protein
MKTHWLRVLIVAAAFGSLAHAASDIVLIDQGDPAYTVYAGLPGERSEDVKGKIANQPVQVVSFGDFSEGRAKFVAARIVYDEYAGLRASEGIVELVRKYPGTPFGLTWNGGIAFTRNDYLFAKSQYGLFMKDADEYKRTRTADAKSDPVNPALHLKPLLGW